MSMCSLLHHFSQLLEQKKNSEQHLKRFGMATCTAVLEYHLRMTTDREGASGLFFREVGVEVSDCCRIAAGCKREK
ncbi:hypothetical protein CEXT_225221 [Caerostris extrusa]|uniref:Uncharacterized protein n=1 Tax=Caerostris extrusa TaxID=172846 RepID=A0AAV4XLF9_CAEEX|nr:hypothetical protein CEXT_225221 [Caerostris extrusa]